MTEILNGKWADIVSGLLADDIEFAIQHFVAPGRVKYRKVFNNLGRSPGTMFADVTGFWLCQLKGKLAECGVIRAENGNYYSYPVTFVQDENGIGRVPEL